MTVRVKLLEHLQRLFPNEDSHILEGFRDTLTPAATGVDPSSGHYDTRFVTRESVAGEDRDQIGRPRVALDLWLANNCARDWVTGELPIKLIKSGQWQYTDWWRTDPFIGTSSRQKKSILAKFYDNTWADDKSRGMAWGKPVAPNQRCNHLKQNFRERNNRTPWNDMYSKAVLEPLLEAYKMQPSRSSSRRSNSSGSRSYSSSGTPRQCRPCPPAKMCNPNSGRCVQVNGPTGRRLRQEETNVQSVKRERSAATVTASHAWPSQYHGQVNRGPRKNVVSYDSRIPDNDNTASALVSQGRSQRNATSGSTQINKRQQLEYAVIRRLVRLFSEGRVDDLRRHLRNLNNSTLERWATGRRYNPDTLNFNKSPTSSR